MNAIDKVISATELNELWQTYKTNLLEARIRWNKCKELRTAGDVAKWVDIIENTSTTLTLNNNLI